MRKSPASSFVVWSAALAVTLAICAHRRLLTAGPWSYDEYFHFGLAREILRSGFPDAFPWTPFSIFAERFADKEPLFHLLLLPFASSPLDRATAIVVVLGLALILGSVALLLRRGGVENGPAWVLAVAGLGPMLAARLGMARPHLLLIAGSCLFLSLLIAPPQRSERARLLILALAAAFFGLAHTGGWIAVVFAAVHGVAGRPVRWRPAAAAAAGWLVGQLVHPNVPANFQLLWVQNVVVPLQAAGAGSAELQQMMGVELTRFSPREVAEQWPVFLVLIAAIVRLARRPAARTRAAVTVTLLAVAFVLAASVAYRRAFELGAPLAVCAAAFAGVGVGGRSRGWPSRLAAAVLWIGAVVWSQSFLVRQPPDSYPRAMSNWLAERGGPGERVFTPQWADSAPLFYAAPQLRSMVALDPTFFALHDPALFRLYTRIAYGGVDGSTRLVRERFGARWVTIWKQRAFQPLAQRLERERSARVVYEDPFYQVWDLGAVSPR